MRKRARGFGDAPPGGGNGPEMKSTALPRNKRESCLPGDPAGPARRGDHVWIGTRYTVGHFVRPPRFATNAATSCSASPGLSGDSARHRRDCSA